MIPLITAFAASPDRGRGQARDMRVRWALEEVGQPYDVQLVSFAQMKEPEHLARQPFGQIPTYQEGGRSCSNPARSCSTLPSSIPACCLPMTRGAPGPCHGCLRR